MLTVWLVLVLSQPGAPPVKLTDKTMPDIESCWTAARHAMAKAAEVAGPFEFQATCAIVKEGADPARLPGG